MAFGIGDTIASMKVKIGADITEFQKTAKRLERSTKPIAQGLKSVGKGLSTFVTLPTLALGAASLKTAADMEQLKNGLTAVLGDAQKAEKEFQALEKAAQLPGLGLEQAVRGSLQLQAVGFQAEFAREALSEFGNALAVSGGTPDDLQEVIRQLSQIESLGKITAENFNVIRERVPLVGRAMQNAFGTTSIEAIRAADVSTQEFIRKLVEGLREVPRAEGGLTNAFVNIRQAAVKALAAIGKAINESFDIEGLVTDFTNTVGRITEAFNNLSPATRKTILVVAGFAAALGPVLLALGGIASAIPFVVAGFGALAGPLGIAVAGIAGVTAAGVALMSNWDDVRSYLDTKFPGSIEFLKTQLKILEGAFKFAKAAVGGIMEGMVDVVGDSLDAISHLMDVFSAAWRKDWQDLLKSTLEFNIDLAAALRNATPASLLRRGAEGVAETYFNAIKKAFRDTGSIQVDLPDFQIRSEAALLGGFAEAYRNAAQGVQQTTKNTSEAVVGLTDDMKQVLSELGASIDHVAARAKVFGTSAFEQANEKAGLIKDAINDLLKEGLEPSSRTIQRMAGELEAVRAAAVNAMAAVRGLRRMQAKGPQETEDGAPAGLTVTADQLRRLSAGADDFAATYTTALQRVSTETLQLNYATSLFQDRVKGAVKNIGVGAFDSLTQAIGNSLAGFESFGDAVTRIMRGVVADIAAAIIKAVALRGIMAAFGPGSFLSSVFGGGFQGAGAGITPPFSMSASTFSPQVSPVALSSHQPFRVVVTPRSTVTTSGDIVHSYDAGIEHNSRGF